MLDSIIFSGKDFRITAGENLMSLTIWLFVLVQRGNLVFSRASRPHFLFRQEVKDLIAHWRVV